MVLIIIDDFRLYRTVCAGPLFFMSGPSAIFGRAPTKRIPPSIREGNGDISRDDVKVDNDRDAPKSKSEMKVRLVQHEIAEKEACKMIQSLCQELSCLSHVDIGGTNYDDIVKVPQIGWNGMSMAKSCSILDSIQNGDKVSVVTVVCTFHIWYTYQ